MKVRNVFGMFLSLMLLFLAAGSGLARGPQPTGDSDSTSAKISSAANAPWFKIEVDTPGDTGQHVSVAIDPSSGITNVSYYDATDERLRMAQYVGLDGNCGPSSSWVCQTVDSSGYVGKYSSIAINPATQGRLGIAYYDSTGDLKYAYVHCIYIPFTDCSVFLETIEEGIYLESRTGLYTSLKYHSNGTPNIAYYFKNSIGVDALMVASYVGTGGNCGPFSIMWRCDTIQTGEGVRQYASLALDGDGNRHITYYDAGNGDLWYAKSGTPANCGPGNTWICYPVTGSTADVGQYASLYVDKNNHFHIAYYNATTDMLSYAVDVGSGGNCGVFGSAQCDEIDSMQTGYHPVGVSIAEDAAGYPIIAYQSQYGSLNIARPVAALGLPVGSGNCGPEDLFLTWYCETINRYPRFVPARHGDFVSIAMNSSGLATIAYYGFITSFDGNLMVSYQRLHVFLPLVMKTQ